MLAIDHLNLFMTFENMASSFSVNMVTNNSHEFLKLIHTDLNQQSLAKYLNIP